jgi:hypothetical protein
MPNRDRRRCANRDDSCPSKHIIISKEAHNQSINQSFNQPPDLSKQKGEPWQCPSGIWMGGYRSIGSPKTKSRPQETLMPLQTKMWTYHNNKHVPYGRNDLKATTIGCNSGCDTSNLTCRDGRFQLWEIPMDSLVLDILYFASLG